MIARFFLVLFLVACGPQQGASLKEWIEEPGYLLDQPLSQQEVDDLEKKLGSVPAKGDDLFICYERKVPEATIFSTRYHFYEGKLKTVHYQFIDEKGVEPVFNLLRQAMENRYGNKGEETAHTDLPEREITWNMPGRSLRVLLVGKWFNDVMLTCILTLEFG